MELKAGGFKGRYLAEYLAVGEAPEELRNVLRQRSRWTKGHMQVGTGQRGPPGLCEPMQTSKGCLPVGPLVALIYGGAPRRGGRDHVTLTLGTIAPLQVFFSGRNPLFRWRLPLIHKWCEPACYYMCDARLSIQLLAIQFQTPARRQMTNHGHVRGSPFAALQAVHQRHVVLLLHGGHHVDVPPGALPVPHV